MRKFLAILVCKLGRAVGKLVGKGSSMPGKFALKICPDILARVQLPSHIIAVTGSNGKTSTVEMIAAILRAGGKTVVYNEEGSNQIEGVTTLVLTHASLTGRVRADVLLIESDERYAAQSFRYFHPTEFVITNLYRDQLTRNGHPEWVYDAILPALHPETELILNADDPLSSCFARGRDRVKWFGLGRCPSDTASPPACTTTVPAVRCAMPPWNMTTSTTTTSALSAARNAAITSPPRTTPPRRWTWAGAP